ncbi:hypothetical protein B0T25DRAFT_563651 [Lasiosphaeria hispida]|uniref:Uncharacterized protein n=1 Tax=Lasiosphaeria hispida TaxID=260671 RepID=A0AAJ0HXD1_9PEZI|nr:hypothetical protein B0T25DRAFT_563651 [Lasiosphaeria hispida]
MHSSREQVAAAARTALKAVEAWKKHCPAGAVLDQSQEFSLIQLRHSHARVTIEPHRGKKLLEEVLREEPTSRPGEPLYNATRRWHLQCFLLWLEYSAEIGLEEGYFDQKEAVANARKFIADFEAGNLLRHIKDVWEKNTALLDNIPLREAFSPILEKEQRAADFSLRTQAQDSSATAALGRFMDREAQKPTEARGSETLGELHKMMFRAAVLDSASPDYKKGLTHLTEALKAGSGQKPSKSLVVTHITVARCHNGLGDPVETGRAVFRAARLLRYEVPASEYMDDSPEDFATWVYSEVAKLDVLEGFNKRRYMWFPDQALQGLVKGETAKAVLAEMEQEVAEFEALREQYDQLLRDAALVLARTNVEERV